MPHFGFVHITFLPRVFSRGHKKKRRYKHIQAHMYMRVPTASEEAREKEEHEKNIDITLKKRNEKGRNVHRVRKRNLTPAMINLHPPS
jgi:protein subunit release factor B